jgi:hypothetical protein
MSVLASATITASAAGNGILVLIACILLFIAAGVAWFVTPRAIWATLLSGGLAVYMLALLTGT